MILTSPRSGGSAVMSEEERFMSISAERPKSAILGTNVSGFLPDGEGRDECNMHSLIPPAGRHQSSQ